MVSPAHRVPHRWQVPTTGLSTDLAAIFPAAHSRAHPRRRGGRFPQAEWFGNIRGQNGGAVARALDAEAGLLNGLSTALPRQGRPDASPARSPLILRASARPHHLSAL